MEQNQKKEFKWHNVWEKNKNLLGNEDFEMKGLFACLKKTVIQAAKSKNNIFSPSPLLKIISFPKQILTKTEKRQFKCWAASQNFRDTDSDSRLWHNM